MLGSMHVMFFREHNRIAREIKKLSPALNDATLYLVNLFKSSKFNLISSSEELDKVFVCQLPQSFSDQCMTNSEGSSCKFIGDTWVEIVPAEKDKTVL